MRVAVTGGAGFIGSNLASRLCATGHDVLVVDDLSTGTRSNLDPGIEFTELDILDPGLDRVLESFRPEAVAHLAAQTSVPASLADPDRDRRLNVEGTRLVARASRRAGARRVVMASTAAVYGEPRQLPLTEDAPTRPVNPYGHSKLQAETVLADVLRPAVADFASLRLANVYGPRQDASGEGGVVAIFIDRALAGQELVVYGDGRQTRDFVYVGDVVSAFEKALGAASPLAGERGAAYNVSTGSETSVLEVAHAVLDASGRAVGITHAPAREGDVERSSLDPTRLGESAGWEAAMPLADGIATTVSWFEARGGRS